MNEKTAHYTDDPAAQGDMTTAHGLHIANGDAHRRNGDNVASWNRSNSNGLPTSVPAANGGRRTSISESLRNNISQARISEAIHAPVSAKLIGLCLIWWTTSLLTNTSSKSILTTFTKPATLTLVQFVFVFSYCLIWSRLTIIFPDLKRTVPALKYPIRRPSRDVIMTTLPMALFQIGGHLLSSNATSMIPVSLVHTIKGLSPLFTVLAYRLVYNIPYPVSTYVALVPLTLGVFLACSGNIQFGGQFLGVIYALLAAIIFVTQNIYSKQLFNERAKAEAEGMGNTSKKLDKLNLLCYSSGLAFFITVPIWFFSEGWGLLTDFLSDGSIDLSGRPNSMDHGRLVLEFFLNGSFHFGQNLIAFVLLGMVSPVTYSVASLIKRVYIILFSLIWFRNPTNPTQAVGIALTFLGLWLYDRSNHGNKVDRKIRTGSTLPGTAPLLPTAQTGSTPFVTGPSSYVVPASGYGYVPPVPVDSKKYDGEQARPGPPPAWLAPGTKQESTWRPSDSLVSNGVVA